MMSSKETLDPVAQVPKDEYFSLVSGPGSIETPVLIHLAKFEYRRKTHAIAGTCVHSAPVFRDILRTENKAIMLSDFDPPQNRR